ncbi:hypothetical protein M9Y10_000821 [Tritrichomonas musculus]|uniref:Uncharacterized protein n=1 Tax=Tritrichomonas musculus TaxID=1915356 RepID=A0ABR2L585_9EUKA
MEEPNEGKTVVSANDLPGLLSIIKQYSQNIDPDSADILKNLKHLFLGLSSHSINKRKGYSLIVDILLKKYKEKISEESAIAYCDSLKFGRDKQKTAIRTATIAKILTYNSFIKSEIITSPENIMKIMTEIHTIGINKPNLAPFAYTVLAEWQRITNFQYLKEFVELLDLTKPFLDCYIFFFKVSNICPPEFRQFLPIPFQPSTYNENTAKNLSTLALSTKQPWNSDIWKVIANETPKQDLLTFWPQVFGQKFIRSTEATFKQNICIMHIVKSVLPTLRSDVYNIIIDSTFIRMINLLITKPQLQPQINDFLNFVVDLADKNREILPNLIDSFGDIDFRQPGGFEFHLNLFNKCDGEMLGHIFEKIKNFNENDKIEFKKRFSSQKTAEESSLSKFKLDTLRAVFISSSRFPDPPFTLTIFKYICENWNKFLTILVPDIVKYDSNRVEGSATLSELAGEPDISDFAACYKLYSLCTGVSSSPSMNTLIAPEINDAQPSTDFILMATQRAGDSVLIVHAFKTYLKSIVPKIPVKEIELFFADFPPLANSYSQATIDIFTIVLNNMESISYNIVAPIFSLFCKTVINIGGNLVQPASDLVKTALRLLSPDPNSTSNVKVSSSFQFPNVLNSIFQSFSTISQKVIMQNQKLINKTFETTMYNVIKAAMPLSPSWNKCLIKNLEAALNDFAFKSNQHFDESFFSAFLRLPDEVTHVLFPLVMKSLPNVTRTQRRLHLIDLVTLIFNQSKGVDILAKYDKYDEAYNNCVLTLLNENYSSKDDEKKFIKFINALTKWFTSMDNKRHVSKLVNIGDIRRKLSSIQNQAHEPLLGSIKQLLQAIQRIENQVHPKQRTYT